MIEIETQITDMESELQKIISGSSSKVKKENYDLILEVLTPIADKLASFCEKYRVIRSLQPPGIPKEEVDNLQTMINTLDSKYVEKDDKVQQDPILHDLTETIEKFVNNHSPQKFWENWKNEILKDCQLPGEDIYRLIPENEQRIEKIGQKSSHLEVLLRSFTYEEKNIPEVNKITSEIRELIDSLEDPKDLPENVKKFLQITRGFGGEFPLEDFNDEIRNWLSEKGMLSQYSIKKRR